MIERQRGPSHIEECQRFNSKICPGLPLDRVGFCFSLLKEISLFRLSNLRRNNNPQENSNVAWLLCKILGNIIIRGIKSKSREIIMLLAKYPGSCFSRTICCCGHLIRKKIAVKMYKTTRAALMTQTYNNLTCFFGGGMEG